MPKQVDRSDNNQRNLEEEAVKMPLSGHTGAVSLSNLVAQLKMILENKITSSFGRMSLVSN